MRATITIGGRKESGELLEMRLINTKPHEKAKDERFYDVTIKTGRFSTSRVTNLPEKCIEIEKG